LPTAIAIFVAAFGLLPRPSNAEWKAQIGVALQKIEVEKRQPLICADSPVIKKYQVVYGQADLVAAALREKYRGSGIQVTALGANAILVFGSASDHDEIARRIAPYQIGGR
jgi:hypothetical protein